MSTFKNFKFKFGFARSLFAGLVSFPGGGPGRLVAVVFCLVMFFAVAPSSAHEVNRY